MFNINRLKLKNYSFYKDGSVVLLLFQASSMSGSKYFKQVFSHV